MRTLFFLTGLFFVSCAGSRSHVQDPCSARLLSGGYTKIGDSAFAPELKKVGRTYLNFIIDSCRTINNSEVSLSGHVSFTEGTAAGYGRKMPDTDIILATQSDKGILRYTQYLGKTDQNGKFDIRVPILKKDLFLLLDKQNFTYTSVSLSF